MPLLLARAGLPRGRVSGELVTNEDIAPTLLEIAGAASSKPVDGRSLIPYARRPKKRSKRYPVHETGGVRPSLIENDGGPPVIQPVPVLTYRGVRTPRYKWIEYRNGSRELYDLARRPVRAAVDARDPRYRLVRRALAREARRLARCAGRACRAAGKPVPAPLAESPCERPRGGRCTHGTDGMPRLTRRRLLGRDAAGSCARFGALGAREFGGEDAIGERRRNVLLIVVDSLRADQLGAYARGWQAPRRLLPATQTPNLDALAGESLRFELSVPETMPTGPARRAIYMARRQFPFRGWKPE